jgi:hypothetical protein
MASAIFLSGKSGKYTLAKMPIEVQFAPVYSIEVSDFNKDGTQDVLFLGNNSHGKLRLGKADANYGVLLSGDGKGGFTFLNQPKSGLNIQGDVRSSVFINNTLHLGLNGEQIKSYKLKD